jgi:mitogen-activated protein kinase 15
MAELFPTASPDAVDLIERCLSFNPDKRPSAAEALKHPYVRQFHNPADEPACPRILRIQIDDNTKYTAADYRDRLYKEIARKKKEARLRRGAGRSSGAASRARAGAGAGGGAASGGGSR